MKAVSIIIPTIKNNITTLTSLEHCPVSHELIISRKYGLGLARNYGAKQARNELLVFLDDDLTLKPEIWKEILDTEKGEFRMIFVKGFPITRVMVIHQEDFWNVGGFDPYFLFSSEDRDFYARALLHGLHFKPIPISLTIHKSHGRRTRNIHVAIRAIYENVYFILKYAGRFPIVLKVDWLDRLKQGQLRTLLIQTFIFYYYLIKGWPKIK